jgi:RNA polymerase sigma-70 factor, ECF subfamily
LSGDRAGIALLCEDSQVADLGSSFSFLIREVRDGRRDATARIVSEFSETLLAIARKRITTRLARRVDAEDLVQSTYRSFFVRARGGQFVLRDRRGLTKLLVTMLLNKLRLKADHHKAARRDMGRETQAWNGAEPLAQVPGEALDPHTRAELREALERLLAQLSEDERAIVEMRFLGESTAEIAASTGRAERSVRRILECAGKRLAKQIA